MKVLLTIFVILSATFCIFGNSDGVEVANLEKMKPNSDNTIGKVHYISEQEESKNKNLLDRTLEYLGFVKGQKVDGEMNNWKNSFLHTEISYGGQKFNVIVDSVYNLLGLPGNFVLDKCPEKADNGTKTSCKRHKMEIFTKKESTIILNEKYLEIEAMNGTKIGVKYAIDHMSFVGHSLDNATFMLLDGTNFKLFGPKLDSGSPRPPKMDGVFSMALGNVEHRSGMEQLLASELNKIATVYTQPFSDLDFFSKTKGVISIGKLDQEHCEFGAEPEWLDIVEQPDVEFRRWKIEMDVRVRQGFSQNNLNSQENGAIHIPGQQVLLSTMDAFLFAPKSFTDPLWAAVEFVDDNAAFEFGREVLGKSGLTPKDVMIKCLSEERKAQMPNLDFIFGSKTFTVGPDDYIMPLKLPLNPIQDKLKVDVLNWCHLMIRPRPDTAMYAHFVMPEQNTDQWVFGQLFFNKACVAFEYGREPKVSLGRPKLESLISPKKH